MKLLAADVGGTNTRLRVSEYSDGKLNSLAEQTYDSQSYKGLIPIVHEFCKVSGISTSSLNVACFAVAGPVRDRCSKVTNLDWEQLDERSLEEQLGIQKVILINDFEGVGYSIDALSKDDLVTLQQGKPMDKAVRLIVGAGTGFGVGIQVWKEGGYSTLPSEAGHTDFAPRDALQMELLAWLKKRSDYVSIEKVLSGIGLVNIYEFLCDQKNIDLDEEYINAKEQGNAASVISERALADYNVITIQSLENFICIYAAQTADLALTTMATGGVYIAGGIGPKIRGWLETGIFTQVFCENPKMSSVLKDMPVHLVRNENPGLVGAMQCALQAVL
jgi:glucokinase